MRPAQDPEVVRKAKEQDWYIDFDDVNPQAREILERYSGIPPGDVVEHVKDIRERAISIFAYPCIGMVKFLDIEVSKTPCYSEILQRLTSSGATYLEVGCCFGQELRQLILDGAPPSSLHGTDLDLDFASLGYALFRDRDRLPPSSFIAADILDPESALSQLVGKVDIIGASLFFHLFDYEQGVAIGKRLVGLLAPGGAKGLMTGGQVGGKEGFEKKSWLGQDLYVYSEDSWRRLWDEVGEATGTRWEVTVREDKIVPTSVLASNGHYFVMRWVVRQL
ncbi:hypothetical protein LEL_06888 [Akanthomyces lecanii RCEF 1005]|uniref:Methyltransferase domain-containing protein n=1 Tax=Akanthomyces lecanii RCEF 1005 TaxID=1081108 RepID=A0A168FAN7_CORDF|nr:hypothetical protein LEL_06888 [Akanthomyces lecanii RCEF 1005]